MRSFFLRNAVSLSAVIIAISTPAVAQAQVRHFNIPAQSASIGIREFAKQAGIQVTLAGRDGEGRKVNAVTGDYDVRDALDRLIAGTGLKVRSFDGSVAILSGGDALSSSDAPDEIVVTGSHISSDGYSAPVPLSVVTAEQISTSGATNVIDELHQSPLIQRGFNVTNGHVDGGAAFVDLRGLGPNRTLTLVNGRRRVSGSSTSSAVDLNTIPASMIERVETTTGGGSAIYGADAVSGVVNVITKKNFEGLEMAAQGGISQRGDSENYGVSLFGGSEFADNRGSINFASSYSKQGGLSWNDRSYTRDFLSHIANPANTGPNDGRPDTYTAHSTGWYASPYVNFYLQGKPWVVNQNDLIDATPPVLTVAGSAGAGLGENPKLGTFTETNYGEKALRLDSKVISLRSDLSYELTDGIKAFVEGEYAQTKVASILSYYRFDDRALWFNGTGGPLIRTDNPYLPASVRALMASAGVTSIAVRKRFNDELPIITDFHNRRTLSVIAGFQGNIFNSWKWELSYQHGEQNDEIETPNLLRGARFKNALDVIADPVTGSPVCRDIAARAAGCVPYNIFVRAPFTDAQRQYFVGTRLQQTRNSQEVLLAHLNGNLIDLPAGPVAVAIGVERRREKLRTRDDGGMISGDLVWGVTTNAAARPSFDKEFKVSEGFAEVVVPVIHDTRFIEALSLNGAVRLSDYNTIGSTIAWQGGVDWRVSGDLRLRGSYSRSVRAPNLFELYSPVSVQQASTVNPCGLSTIDTTANRRANCMLLGNPAGGGIAILPQVSVVSGGNPDVQEETSNSFTVGAIVTPRILPDLRLSIDYYKIKISDVIASFGTNDMVRSCLDAASMENNSFCEGLTFAPGGNLSIVRGVLMNASNFSTSGIDFSAQYRLPVGEDGRIGLSINGTYLLKKEFIGIAGNAATLSIQDGEFSNPRVRMNVMVSYDHSKWGATVTNRFISAGVIDRQALPEAYDLPNVPHRIYTDLVLRYNLSDKVSGFMGINNALDIKPPRTVETYTYDALYDTIGRFFHAGIKARF